MRAQGAADKENLDAADELIHPEFVNHEAPLDNPRTKCFSLARSVGRRRCEPNQFRADTDRVGGVAALVISERTVATHTHKILEKLKLRSRVQVAAWAVEQELLR